jgi:RNA polymerase sigma-70 factor (ECF subfamily)
VRAGLRFNDPVHPNVLNDSRVTTMVEARTELDTESPRATFEELFRAEYASVVRALVIVAGNKGAAEELAQEAFARTYERWDRVRDMRSPAGYVYRSALNAHRSRLRRVATALRHRRAEVLRTNLAAEDATLQAQVKEMLASLPPAQREALMLVEWLGYTAEEAAKVLGIRPSSVRGRLHRARTALRARFGGEDG